MPECHDASEPVASLQLLGCQDRGLGPALAVAAIQVDGTGVLVLASLPTVSPSHTHCDPVALQVQRPAEEIADAGVAPGEHRLLDPTPRAVTPKEVDGASALVVSPVGDERDPVLHGAGAPEGVLLARVAGQQLGNLLPLAGCVALEDVRRARLGPARVPGDGGAQDHRVALHRDEAAEVIAPLGVGRHQLRVLHPRALLVAAVDVDDAGRRFPGGHAGEELVALDRHRLSVALSGERRRSGDQESEDRAAELLHRKHLSSDREGCGGTVDDRSTSRGEAGSSVEERPSDASRSVTRPSPPGRRGSRATPRRSPARPRRRHETGSGSGCRGFHTCERRPG